MFEMTGRFLAAAAAAAFGSTKRFVHSNCRFNSEYLIQCDHKYLTSQSIIHNEE